MPVHKKYNRNVKTNALGRGLDALISTESVSTQGSSTINEVPLQQIEANPNQPRREFDPVALEELASSIRQLGIVQPITLRQVDHDRFQIIAGERRWRASQLAGLTTIPAYIRTIKDENVMEMALVENIQREDLNANMLIIWKLRNPQCGSTVGDQRNLFFFFCGGNRAVRNRTSAIADHFPFFYSFCLYPDL